MPVSPALSALITKRAELVGQIEAGEQRLRQLYADLAHVDGAIRVFDPSYPPDLIPPKRPVTSRELFGHAELTKLVLDILRTAERPMTAPAVAKEVMRRKELPQDGRTRRIVCKRVDRTLWRQERLLERIGKPGVVGRWRIQESD